MTMHSVVASRAGRMDDTLQFPKKGKDWMEQTRMRHAAVSE